MIARKAKHRGVAGFIIDGLIRDLASVCEIGMPVYTKGVTPVGPLHRGPGEVNYPICCGGIVVNPGDLVSADTSGVVVVHNYFAQEVLKRLEKQRDRLAEYNKAIDRGDFSNTWVDDYLHNAGCVYED